MRADISNVNWPAKLSSKIIVKNFIRYREIFEKRDTILSENVEKRLDGKLCHYIFNLSESIYM